MHAALMNALTQHVVGIPSSDRIQIYARSIEICDDASHAAVQFDASDNCTFALSVLLAPQSQESNVNATSVKFMHTIGQK
jgi:hypothetical protein